MIFIKSFSLQVLKANMRIVGATKYALVLYRNKLPKFRNNCHAVKNWFEFKIDGKEIPRLHPMQKPVNLLKKLIEIFTDKGDIVIDPCAGSRATLRAVRDMNRDAYGNTGAFLPQFRTFFLRLFLVSLLKPVNELFYVREYC